MSMQTQTPVLGCIINKVVITKLLQKRYYYQYGGGYDYYANKADTKKKSLAGSKGRRK